MRISDWSLDVCSSDLPDAVMALIPGRPQGEYVLFCRDKDKAAEIWPGFRAGPDGAVAQFDANDAFPIGDIDDLLPGQIGRASCREGVCLYESLSVVAESFT